MGRLISVVARPQSAPGCPERAAGHRLRADLDQPVAFDAVEEEVLRDRHCPPGGGDRLEARPGEGPGVCAALPPSDRDRATPQLGLVMVVVPVGESGVQARSIARNSSLFSVRAGVTKARLSETVPAIRSMSWVSRPRM